MWPRECRKYDSENLRLFLMVAVRAGRGTCLCPRSHRWGWGSSSRALGQPPSVPVPSVNTRSQHEPTLPFKVKLALQGQASWRSRRLPMLPRLPLVTPGTLLLLPAGLGRSSSPRSQICCFAAISHPRTPTPHVHCTHTLADPSTPDGLHLGLRHLRRIQKKQPKSCTQPGRAQLQTASKEGFHCAADTHIGEALSTHARWRPRPFVCWHCCPRELVPQRN